MLTTRWSPRPEEEQHNADAGHMMAILTWNQGGGESSDPALPVLQPLVDVLEDAGIEDEPRHHE